MFFLFFFFFSRLHLKLYFFHIMYSFARDKTKKGLFEIEAKATAIIKLADRIVSDRFSSLFVCSTSSMFLGCDFTTLITQNRINYSQLNRQSKPERTFKDFKKKNVFLLALSSIFRQENSSASFNLSASE